MIVLTGEEAGMALGLPSLATPVMGVSIDSRTLRPGDLFVALRGARFDGHDFVQAAFAAGAAGAIVEKKAWTETRQAQIRGEKRPVYLVDDTLSALSALARAVRRKSGVTVLAVTGSVGKTSTKDLLFALVSQVRRAIATRENENNEVGVPLTLLSIGPDTEVAVVEMAMRGRGQIAALARIAEPEVGIITNVHPVHLELLGSLEAIAQAKVELLQNLRPDGVGVVPWGCKIIEEPVGSAGCRVIRFVEGLNCAEAEIRGVLRPRGDGLNQDLIVQWPEGEAVVEVGPTPPGFLENVLAAAAGCYAAGLPVAACLGGVTGRRASSRRWRVLELPGLVVIDDSYNANPVAVQAALEELVRLAGRKGGRAVAVLGDMLELGREEARYHWEVGQHAAEVGVRLLWGVGRLARWMVEGYLAKQRGDQDSSGEAPAGHLGPDEEISLLIESLRPGDVVLFKASRSLGLDRLVDQVVAEAELGRWGGGRSQAGRPRGGS